MAATKGHIDISWSGLSKNSRGSLSSWSWSILNLFEIGPSGPVKIFWDMAARPDSTGTRIYYKK
jgi:hypothetical protein